MTSWHPKFSLVSTVTTVRYFPSTLVLVPQSNLSAFASKLAVHPTWAMRSVTSRFELQPINWPSPVSFSNMRFVPVAVIS